MEHTDGEMEIVDSPMPGNADFFIKLPAMDKSLGFDIEFMGDDDTGNPNKRIDAERVVDLWNAFDGIDTHEAMNIAQVARHLHDNPADLKYLEYGAEMEKMIKRVCSVCSNRINSIYSINISPREHPRCDRCSKKKLISKLEGGG